MKAIFTSTLLLAACGSDPLEPGAGDDPGGGTATLLVDGRASAEPTFANARLASDFSTEFSIRITLGGQPVTTGSVTVSSRFTTTPLSWQPDTDNGRWVGTAANYDEVYQLDVVSGGDEVTGVIVDGPDIHELTSPAAGATLDSTMENPITWSRGETADLASLDTDEIDRITITDSGDYMMSAGVLKADKEQARENQIELRRTNHVVPGGAVAGSDFAVTVENRLTVIAAPNPAL